VHLGASYWARKIRLRWQADASFKSSPSTVARNVGVAIVSELDARTYHGQLNFRPFTPNIPHQLSLVRPKHQTASMITLDFMEQFKASLEDLLV
jgi:DNA-binding transcriptional LysR family regulator